MGKGTNVDGAVLHPIADRFPVWSECELRNPCTAVDERCDTLSVPHPADTQGAMRVRQRYMRAIGGEGRRDYRREPGDPKPCGPGVPTGG